MRYPVFANRGFFVALALATTLAACATNPNKPPDPGSRAWYEQRIQEIEAAKAAGQLTEEQYLSLKNEADATRAARLDAMRNNDYPPVGLVFGFGTVHHHHSHPSPPHGKP
jgi:hypothetical protein